MASGTIVPKPAILFKTINTVPAWQTNPSTSPVTVSAGGVAYANITALVPDGYVLASATILSNFNSGEDNMSWLTATVNAKYVFLRNNRSSGDVVITNCTVKLVFVKEV